MAVRTDRGFTLIELLIVVALVGVIAAIGTASLLSARMSSNEASAIGSLRSILSGQILYHTVHRGYAGSLATLATVCPGSTVAFISPDLNADGVLKSGYTFFLAPGSGSAPGPLDCNGTATETMFYTSAVPLTVGLTGNRGFAANQGAVIWHDVTGAVPTEPFTATATVSPIGR